MDTAWVERIARDPAWLEPDPTAGTLRLFEVEIWWELATLITIMLLGHWLEMRSIAQAQGALSALAALVPGASAEVSGLTATLRVPRAGTELRGLLRHLDKGGIALDSIEVRRPTLDDVFLTVTGRSLREDA